MKKQIILFLFILGNLTTSFSQNKKTAFDDLVGTYQGIIMTAEGIDGANNVTAEMTADFNLKVTENFDGLFVEHINEKVSPQAGGEMKDGIYVFEFKAVSKESEFSLIRVMIHNEAILPGTNLSMSIAYKKHSEEQGIFAVSKEGVSPKKPTARINFSDIHNFVFFSGKTQDNTFGDFKIEWYPSHQFGYLRYKHVTNVFKITNREGKYFLHHNNTNDIELEFRVHYSNKLKLQKIHKGKSLFEMSKVKQYQSDKAMKNKEECLVEIGNFFYDMIHDEFKRKGDYTLNHKNKSNGKGIKFILSEDKPLMYAGGFKDGIYNGEGFSTTIEASEKGSYKKGIRHGHFYVSNSEGDRASGEYKDGVQDGLWKVQKANGATFDLVFQNGKKISTTATNKGVKNTQIAKHVEDAQFQLKSSKRLVKEIVSISNGCSNRTTIRDYQVCIRPIKRKIDLFATGIVAADRELTKAIKEAKRIGCTQTLQILKNAEEDLWEANGNFGKAYKAITEAYHATTVANLRTEFRKSKAALRKAAEAMDEYFFWINALTLETCYEYSTTDNSTLPSRKSSQRKSSSNSSSSYSTNSSNNKTTSQTSNAFASKPVVYPAFTGKYEGDNLLRLMGRKVDDPAVQKLLKNPKYKFEKKDRSGSLREKIDYECYPYRFSLSFINGIMTYISFEVKEWDNEHYFKKKLPLNIPLAKSTSAMKRMKDKWKHNDYGSSSNWTLKKYQLKFETWGGGENNNIHIVNINAEDIKDWNSYYQQFQ